MNVIQKRLVDNYATQVIGNKFNPNTGITINEVPETKVIGGVEYAIRSEVLLEIERRLGYPLQ